MQATQRASLRERNQPRSSDDEYTALLGRLSRQSVTKRFEAYKDVQWDDPAFAIDRGDARWELSERHPLGATSWYKRLPQPARAELGLRLDTGLLKLGVAFENVLERGLLDFALRLPNDSPEFRYVYHEIAEETQHSLMFQEFVNRASFDEPGLVGLWRLAVGPLVSMNRIFPELFFVYVLGGEEPLDYLQREAARVHNDLHPLIARITQIHVTEEARHMCFAHAYLERAVPKLSMHRRLVLQAAVPLLLRGFADLLFLPSKATIRAFRIPSEVLDEAFHENPAHRERVVEAFARVRKTFTALGILDRPFDGLWKRVGLAN